MVLSTARGRAGKGQLEFVDNKAFAGSSLVSGCSAILVQSLTKRVIILSEFAEQMKRKRKTMLVLTVHPGVKIIPRYFVLVIKFPWK